MSKSKTRPQENMERNQLHNVSVHNILTDLETDAEWERQREQDQAPGEHCEESAAQY
jgi:hypothetical protein